MPNLFISITQVRIVCLPLEAGDDGTFEVPTKGHYLTHMSSVDPPPISISSLQLD